MSNSIFISDDLFGFDVSYTVEKIPSQKEECHGEHELGLGWEIELKNVKLVLNSDVYGDLDILPIIPESAKDEIIKRIHEEIINS